jgi:hypothetical protein
MPESLGAMQVCDAASKGDVQTLKLLIECAGIQVKQNTSVCLNGFSSTLPDLRI